MAKIKPNRIMSRMCHRHERYVKECPRCNVEVPCDEHMDYVRNLKVITPVYRVKQVYKGKQYNQTAAPITTQEAV